LVRWKSLDTRETMPVTDNHDHHTHDSHHDHGSQAGHAHAHAPTDFGRAFAIGTALNAGFVLLEAIYGFQANSVALLADAGHNLGDVFGLLMAWGASALVKRPPTPRFTYGYRSSTILAALGNAVLLLVATGAIAWEAVQRLGSPEPVAAATVMIVAAIGIAINGFTAWMFMAGRGDDINIKAAYAHMAADAVVAAGVVAAGLAIAVTGWRWVDPVTSLIISAVIVWGTWGLLRGSVELAMNAVPSGIDPAKVRKHLEALPGVSAIHDLHIWPMSTTEAALTCHLVMPMGAPDDTFIAKAGESIKAAFGIAHSTLQIERGDGAECALAPDHVV